MPNRAERYKRSKLKPYAFFLSFLLPLVLTSALIFPAKYAVFPVARADAPATAQNSLYSPHTLKTDPSHPDPSYVNAYVEAQAKAVGINPVDAVWIVGHESQDGRNMTGDDGQSRGYWMISKIYHPEVSDACAYDLACSTSWSLHWILAGHISEWSTYRFCKLWYPDCPF